MAKTLVLDQGYVELIAYLPHPATGISGDMWIVMAARTSYLGTMKGKVENERLLADMYTDKHMPPFEQVQFTFQIRAPLVVWWQWVRHRTQKYDAQSGRYVKFKRADMYNPSEWRTGKGTGALAGSEADLLSNALEEQYASGFQWYEEALARGVDKEQARLFLPAFGLYYTFWVGVDARNLMGFLRQRLDSEAQYEIRVFAEAVFDIFEHKLPLTAALFRADIGYEG